MPTICAAICCFIFPTLLVAPLSTLSDFQISVCRGMCQFRTDDLVFTHTHITMLHTLKGPLHTLHCCEHSEMHRPFYMKSVYSKDVNGCGKCQLWNW